MKKIKTNTILKYFDGENLKSGGKDLTVGYIISNVLGGKVSNPTLGWQLGKKFATEKEVELSAEDIIFIKKELESNEYWAAIAVGQIIELLEKSDSEK